MAPVNLSRLRPQITALSSQFNDNESYMRSLKALLDNYSSNIDIAIAGIKPHSLIPKLNIPSVVIQQLEISYKYLATQYPENAIFYAKELWKFDFLEYKQISLILLSLLPEQSITVFFDNLQDWVTDDLEEPIMAVILKIVKNNTSIINHPSWIETIKVWLSNDSLRVRKLGLRAIADFIEANSDESLPFVFKQIGPIFSEPNISIQKELLNIINFLVDKSANETAAFLINLGTLHPSPTMHGFIRKSIRLFPDNLAQNIGDSLT